MELTDKAQKEKLEYPPHSTLPTHSTFLWTYFKVQSIKISYGSSKPIHKNQHIQSEMKTHNDKVYLYPLHIPLAMLLLRLYIYMALCDTLQFQVEYLTELKGVSVLILLDRIHKT